MSRNKALRDELNPERYEWAWHRIKSLGYDPQHTENENEFTFLFKGNKIRFYPYTGWTQGKGIKPCRGLVNLLKQIQ